MSNLVITIISITLMAVVTLSLGYYMNMPAERSQRSVAAASTLDQASQVAAAMQLHLQQNGYYPNSVAELETAGLLQSMPAGDWYIANGFVRLNLGTTQGARIQCMDARRQMGFSGQPKFCDDSTLQQNDPCCIQP